MNKAKLAIISLALACSPLIANAESQTYLTPYIGGFDILESKDRKPMLGLEARFEDYYGIFTPKFGIYSTTETSVYTYLGFNLIFPFNNQWRLMPGFAVGYYSHNSGKNLGGPYEFRSSVELNYQMVNKHRIGLAFSHTSNAGIYSKNPGAEDLLLTYGVPFSIF